MKNYKKNIAIVLASSMVFISLPATNAYAMNKENEQEISDINKNLKENTIKPMSLKKVNNNKNIDKLKVSSEKPYTTYVNKSQTSIGEYYYAEISISGQAKEGSTVYAKMGNQEAKYVVGDRDRFGFNISTHSKDVSIELYTINSDGKKSDSTYVKLTPTVDHIMNGGNVEESMPDIVAKDTTIHPGTKFNPLDYVKAIDDEDGDITSKVEVKENTVDTSKIGEYKVIYSVMDNDYNITIRQINVNTVATNYKKSLTTDINKYDIGEGEYLTYINGKGYSQFVYLNNSEKYAFTPSSWIKAAGLNVSIPTSDNGYTMVIENKYIAMHNEANELLNNIKSGRVDKSEIREELERIEELKDKRMSGNQYTNLSIKTNIKKTLTNDIHKYDAGKGQYLTYINGNGYSQYSYLNTSEKYAFTPSSWMKAAGLNVTMPTSSNSYKMEITNLYIEKYENTLKEIESYL